MTLIKTLSATNGKLHCLTNIERNRYGANAAHFQPCWECMGVFIAGTLGCVFIDNETHESGVTKCTTGEAWSAFSWHHSSVFHCQWTHNQVFLLLSHMLIWNAKSTLIYVMKYVPGFIWKLGINFAVCIKGIDETWWNNRLLLVPNCYEVIAMVATVVAIWLHHCDVIHWDKQSCVTMAVDL